jgi:iron complex transport system substrate-binding protein
MFPPERIICLTEETVETLYLLSEDSRIVGISGYVVRPPRARREKPRVSAFTSADIPKILDLKPDLVLTFSDLQADIAAALIRAHVDVHAFNQRTVTQILDMIRTLGALVGAAERADRLASELAAKVSVARKRAARLRMRPRVYFEEWDEPMISGIGWVSELIEAAGGVDVFADRASCKSAKDRIVTAQEVIRNEPGCHYRLVVRQKISSRKARQETRLRSHPGGKVRSAARDQIAVNPTAGPSRAD